MRNVGTGIGQIGFYGLLASIFLSALPLGTAGPISKSALCFSICIFAGFRVTAQIYSDGTFRLSRPYIFLPLAGILALAVLQLLFALTLDPYETRVFIISFATVLIAGEALSYYATTPLSIKALIATVLVTAAASAVFGALRELFLDDRLQILQRYFPPGTQGYAQFVNRNHFALLIEMALGLTIGILFKGRPSSCIKVVLLLLAGIFAYSAIAANSRGGVVSCVALTAAAVFIHFMTKRSSRPLEGHSPRFQLHGGARMLVATLFCLMTIGVSVFTIAFVGGDDIVGRMERLEDEVSENRMNRLAIWRSTIGLIEDYPVTGVGFGAYAAAIPKYVPRAGNWRMEQAHNEYLEILANGGSIALLLFAVSAYFVFRRSMAHFRSEDPLIRSSCFGALIGMLGVLIHSTVDFGLHIMINGLVLMVLIVIATSQVDHTKARHDDL